MNSDKKSVVAKWFSDRAFNMIRPPYDKLKYSFIDPGSQYDGQLWDWDSYFSAKALMAICEYFKDDKDFDYEKKKKLVIDSAKGSLKNFVNIQLEDGYIPIMTNNVRLNDKLWIGIHKEKDLDNQHKPFLCQATLAVSKYDNDYDWFNLEPLFKYFDYYDKKQFHARSGLYVWKSDIMIGMDNNPSVYGLPYETVGDIYLNSFMYMELLAFYEILKIKNHDRAEEFYQKAERLKNTIREECWDKRDEIYYSVFVDLAKNHTGGYHTGMKFFWKSLPIKIRMAVCFLPIYAGIATKEETEIMIKKHYLDPAFLSPYGLRSISADEKMYCLIGTSNPSNSLGPVWMIYNYLAFESLKKAGRDDLAKDLCDKMTNNFYNDIVKNGKVDECYNPDTGEPIMNQSFISWNALIVKMIKECE